LHDPQASITWYLALLIDVDDSGPEPLEAETGDLHLKRSIDAGARFLSYTISAVDQGAKTFTVVGRCAARFDGIETITVWGSTGNDGDYSLVGAVESGDETILTVSEAIPDSTADGYVQEPIIVVAEDLANPLDYDLLLAWDPGRFLVLDYQGETGIEQITSTDEGVTWA
jgi:hypothetical protein